MATDTQRAIIKIYTDGGYSMKINRGGWAFAVVKDNKVIRSISEGSTDSTNNRMELMAVIRAMRYCRGHADPVEIVTDSEYVKRGLTEWLPVWKNHDWRTKAGSPVKNPDLWKELDVLYSPDKFIMSWTRGHNGDEFNDFVDNLCTEQIQKEQKT